MYTPISLQELDNARQDVESLEKFVNGDENTAVNTRLGEFYPSAKKAIKEMFENGGLPATPFETKVLMTASSLANGTYAVVTNDITENNNGYYLKKSGSWVFSGYNPFTQLKNYTDSNALFKPQRLESTTVIDNTKTAGIYHVPTDSIALALNLPDAAEGQVYVSGNTKDDGFGYVFQTYINKIGNTYQRVYTGSAWSDWVGNYAGIATYDKNLNDFTRKGTYHAFTSGMATTAKNYPFTGAGGILTVMNDGSVVRQNYVSTKGIAQRFGVTSNSVTTWQGWSGVEYDSTQIAKISAFLKEGGQPYKVVTSIAEITGNLNTLLIAGAYFINSGTVASTANGFPITGSGGFLDVKVNASNAVHQRWTNINGYAYRWGAISGGVATWQPWRGVKNDQNGIIDLTATSTSNTKLVVYGSSTMWYLTDEFQELATRKSLDLLTYAQSGDTLGGAGLGSGASRVTMTVTGGELTKDTYVPVTFTSEFGNYLRKLITVELSNGVKGVFNPNTSAFYAQNITGTMSVPSTEAFDVKSNWLKPDDGVYVIDIGKNDVSSTGDNSQFIIDRTIDIINDLPKDSKFIVGGHYSNTDSTDTHRTVVEAVNLALKNKYGLKYFDISSILFDDATWTKLGLTKTAADNTAISQRRLPPSLSRDNAHLSPAMDIELALVIENKLTSLGYIS